MFKLRNLSALNFERDDVRFRSRNLQSVFFAN